MLHSLDIRDFALIEKLHVDWTPGLNVLTGETGAGKSILMDALNAVLGGKAGPSLIRNGADKASIEAEFALQPAAIAWLKKHELIEDEGETFVISREISKSGTRTRINGTMVNSALTQELAQMLLTVHAQHESRTLMSPQSQLEMLDSLGDPAHKKLLEKVRTLYARKKDIVAQLHDFQMSEDERIRKLDFGKFQQAELEEARLENAGEDEELLAQRMVLANVSLLEKSINDACALLSGEKSEGDHPCAIDLLQSALVEIERATKYDPALAESCDAVRSGVTSIEEATRSMKRYAGQLDTDPEALAHVEARVAQLASIKRKYGPTLQEAIERRDALTQEIERLENSQSAIEDLQNDLNATNAQLSESAGKISATRKKLAAKLGKSVEQELGDLGMERCRFDITFDELNQSSSHGTDRIEFVIAPNPGQPLMPLGKIASGGELSRIMLAVKTIFASSDQIPTVIFDEIDTGLSGRVLQSMRDKLATLAKSHQILCITHQPIIASIADNHVEVRKEQSASNTKVSAARLSEDDRLHSLASMASGQENQESLNFVKQLVDQANQIKGSLHK
jgi:DNA repair protein RecN (Recombination protein N)